MDNGMDCVEFEKLIPLYLTGRLDSWQLDRFADHLVACGACEEKLFIEFEDRPDNTSFKREKA